MNIPNIISLFRVLLIPFFAVVFLSDNPYSHQIAGTIFAVACISDVIDGYIARKYKLITKLGEALDPLADKLMQMTVIMCLFYKNTIGLWIVFAFLFKEVLMIMGGTVMLAKVKHVIPSRWYGKVATVLFALSVFICIIFANISKLIVNLMFVVALFMSLFAFINYYHLYIKEKKKAANSEGVN